MINQSATWHRNIIDNSHDPIACLHYQTLATLQFIDFLVNKVTLEFAPMPRPGETNGVAGTPTP
jgi:hypothetical protein